MRQNTRKFKPNPSNNSRNKIRSSSIRDIIGDRRFKDVTTHRTEGLEKVKRMKVGDAEAEDLPSLGQNVSSIQCEGIEDPIICSQVAVNAELVQPMEVIYAMELGARLVQRNFKNGITLVYYLLCCCGDFAAKTSEYAFFKRMKESTCNNVNEHPKYRDNKLNNVQQSDVFTREEIPNLQKESMGYARSSLPVEKELDNATYSFLSPPCCGSKNFSEKNEVNTLFGATGTNVHNIRPGEYKWLSPSVGSKIKTSGKKGLFASKREKLQRWIADKALYDVDEISSKGSDLVSVLINRLLPEDHENNHRRDPVRCQDENDSKYKLPSFSEPKAATLIKSHEDYKTRIFESCHKSNLDDGFIIPTERLRDTDLWEWDPTGSEYSSVGHVPKSGSQFNGRDTEGGFRIPKFAIESISSFDEPILRYGSGNFEELERSDIHNGHNLLEQPHTLLLGWEDKGTSNKDEYQLSTWDSQKEINTSSNSQDNYYIPNVPLMSSPPSSPYIDRKHFLGWSSLPYTPKHLTWVDDCSINFPPQHYTWRLNESLNEKENRESGSESFLFLIQSPANNLLRFMSSGLHSFAFNIENEENLLHSPDEFPEVGMKIYHPSSYGVVGESCDHIGYPLLLGDSRENEW